MTDCVIERGGCSGAEVQMQTLQAMQDNRAGQYLIRFVPVHYVW